MKYLISIKSRLSSDFRDCLTDFVQLPDEGTVLHKDLRLLRHGRSVQLHLKLIKMNALRLLVALLICSPLAVLAQIHGEGDIVKQEIQLETLTGVGLAINADVILTQGSSQKVVMEGQQNVLDNIKRTVKGGSWSIGYEKNVRNAKPVTIRITMATLDEVAVSGSGNVSAIGTFTGLEDVETAVSGSGGIHLAIEAGKVEAAISGSGEIILKGTARSLEAAISGSGDVDAQDLKTTDCEVAISGSGDVAVNCTGTLEAAISGSGDVRYKGDAPKVRASVSGSGDVTEID